MKIMHIGQLIGGLDIYIRNIVSSTSPDIEYVMLYGKDDNPHHEYFAKQNITMHETNLCRQLNPFNDIKALSQILKYIKAEKPDIIHCHSAKGGFLGRVAGWITGIKTLYTPHAFSFLSTSSKLKSKIFKLLERLAVLDSYLLACSDSERELGIKQVGYKEDKAIVWHNSIPSAANIQTARPIADNVVRPSYICYMARPSYQKNPFFLLKVMNEVHKLMPDLRFCLLGVGYHSPNIEDLKEGIKMYGLSDCVDLHPWLSHDESIEHIRNAKLYFSVSRYEGMSLTILEAMSLGKAIIASDVIGNKDCVFDGENGYLLPFDAQLFANKIVDVIANDNLRKTLETKSLEIFEERFIIDKQIAQLQQIYSA